MKRTSVLGISAIVLLLTAMISTLLAAGWLWGLDGVRAMQALGGWLKLPMELFTFLGDEQFYLVAIPLDNSESSFGPSFSPDGRRLALSSPTFARSSKCLSATRESGPP